MQAKDELLMRFHNKPDGLNNLERAIYKESDQYALNYISGHLNLKLHFKNIILTTANSSYIDDVDFDSVKAIINLEPANCSKNQDKLLKAVNTLLPDAGIYIGLFDDFAFAGQLSDSLTNYGFEIVDLRVINKSNYFVALKTSDTSDKK
jgi:hypothetical protein